MKKMLLILTLVTLPLYAALATGSSPGNIIYTEPLKAVIFSHGDHLTQGTVCSDCHSGLFEMQALAVQQRPDFTMESLYQGKYCGACHDGQRAFAADTQCARCHIGVKGYERLQDRQED